MGDVAVTPAELVDVRDVGGAPVVGGGRVRRGLLLRSDGPDLLDAGSCGTSVTDLGVRTVVDLRSMSEVERTGAVPVVGGVPHVEHVPIDDGALVDPASRHAHMTFVAGRQVGLVIRHVACDEHLPTLLFSTAGSDRTGLVVALVLVALGVADRYVAAEHDAPAVMVRLLDSIRSRHGSVASYLASIGVDEPVAARLRRSLVER